jgi:hypothetical protein
MRAIPTPKDKPRIARVSSGCRPHRPVHDSGDEVCPARLVAIWSSMPASGPAETIAPAKPTASHGIRVPKCRPAVSWLAVRASAVEARKPPSRSRSSSCSLSRMPASPWGGLGLGSGRVRRPPRLRVPPPASALAMRPAPDASPGPPQAGQRPSRQPVRRPPAPPGSSSIGARPTRRPFIHTATTMALSKVDPRIPSNTAPTRPSDLATARCEPRKRPIGSSSSSVRPEFESGSRGT